VVECHFDEYFDQQIRELEKTALNQDKRVAEATALVEEAPRSVSQSLGDEPPPLPGNFLYGTGQSKNTFKVLTSNESTPIATPDNSRPSTPAGHLLTGKAGPGGKGSRRARKAANAPSAHASSGEESYAKKSRAGKTAGPKKGRKWDADGLADEDSDTPLDYSAPTNGATSGEDEIKERPGAVQEVDSKSWGSKTGGRFVLKDLDDQVQSILESADAKKSDSTTAPTGIVGSSFSAIGGLFRNVVGGKTLTKEDLDKAMKGMEDHLLRKNVAREAAIRLCEGVERELIGVKTASFESQCAWRYVLNKC
jgi:signal recognition particle receptor subunit alpha